jgi:hypothetical protein
MFVIVVLMISLATGQPVIIGEYNAANYPTIEACKAALPDAIKAIDAANADQQIKVRDSDCVSREMADKIHERLAPRKDSI